MIHGILTFKPLDAGKRVQIIIEGDPKDIPELARLFGRRVQVDEERPADAAHVQTPAEVMAKNIMSKFDALLDEMIELHTTISGSEGADIIRGLSNTPAVSAATEKDSGPGELTDEKGERE